MRQNQLSWMTGGAQGSGVDSAANIFAKACTYGGLHVYGKREYYSNIIGEHSYFQVRVAETTVRAHVDTVDLLVTFDAETVIRHGHEVAPGGAIIFDPTLSNTPINKLENLEPQVTKPLLEKLRHEELPATMAGALKMAERRGVKMFPAAYDDFVNALIQELNVDSSRAKKTLNTLSVAVSLGILEYDFDMLARALEAQFRGKTKVIATNIKAAEKAYDFGRSQFAAQFACKLRKVKTTERRLYLTGYQAIALGKLAGGCTFQTYYPITPASDESVYLESHEVFPLRNGSENGRASETGSIVVVQTEDEIAALTMAIGAALAGARAATATSGPGFSLMAEGTGWAGMNEVPVVITLYSRGGPATGLPTRHEQGDLRFALHAAHGEFPRLVLASGDIDEAFHDAVHAFNYAEQYQTPVVHIVDKALANSTQTVTMFDLDKLRLKRGKILSEAELASLQNGGYKRFAFVEDGVSPRSFLGSKHGLFWNTGDEHDESGHITEDPTNRVMMMDKRMRKLETAAREIPLHEKFNFFGDPDAPVTIVSWGSTKGAILDAMNVLQDQGMAVNFLQARLIHPLPAEEFTAILRRAKTTIGVEMNYLAQFAGVVREHTGIALQHLIVKYNGRPISRDEIVESIKNIVTKKTTSRKVVLTYGV
ncbi:MAG: 2-oxoacid:ferredoxin oxidoreductase subunit alpha [candidate division KSB1 bacterium]|nr:2-oxoacid:ferredoxin oxidoreductase subunit alpha [candidate division KSB1 bacterium]MDZ7368433.1 2-oxoacid:ferredoxin oxidoreductase subunit alpha [candidate division KSB1 bacterium]MDZ7406159.1 2-oxoacid:ferredoxin oxidoreductase subunit alpha [candidate division KSB1 bacterium]